MSAWRCSECGPINENTLVSGGAHTRLVYSLDTLGRRGAEAVTCRGQVTALGEPVDNGNEWQWRADESGRPVFVEMPKL